MKKGLAVLLLTQLTAGAAFSIETQQVDLKAGADNDGLVRIYRDGPGNLLLDDAYTTPATLSHLISRVSGHGVLLNLDQDHHPHYLTVERHDSVHSQAYNGALAVPADPAGNQTLGAHTADPEIHLHRQQTETISGDWSFSGELEAAGGSFRFGPSQYAQRDVIGFADPQFEAEFWFEADEDRFYLSHPLQADAFHAASLISGRVNGVRTAALEGFDSIEGIPVGELVSSTADEDISGRWQFLTGADATGIALTGLSAVSFRVRNTSGGTISPGEAVKWAAMESENAAVIPFSESYLPTKPFAGIALESAASQGMLDIAVLGAVPVSLSGTQSIAPGDLITWGSGGALEGGPAIGFALESATTGQVMIFLTPSR